MAWLDKLLGRGTSREIEEAVEAPAPPKPSNPPLLLLVSDASGMAAFRLIRFGDAAAACEYVEFWRPSSSAGTVYAVWGLPGEPDARWTHSPEQRGEAVVLVRDDRQLDVVYPFSFIGFDSAWAFVRHEIEKELDPNRMMIYWAVPVEITADAAGKTHMSPETPPEWVPATAAAPAEREAQEAQPGTIFGFEGPAAEKESLEAAEQLFEGDGDDVPADVGEASGDANAGDEQREPESVAADEEKSEEVAAAVEAEPIQALPELVVEKFGTPFHADEFTEAPAPDQEASKANGNGTNGASKHSDGTLEEPVADVAETDEVKVEPAKKKRGKNGKGRRTKTKSKKQVKQAEVSAADDAARSTTNGHEANGAEPWTADVPVLPAANGHMANGYSPWTAHETVQPTANGHAANGNGQKPEPEPAQAAANGNEPWIAHTPVQATTNGHAANGNGQSGSDQDVDLAEEIAKVLEGRKQTQQEGPFKGFNSPPGRF
jgi:hypothetical protein